MPRKSASAVSAPRVDGRPSVMLAPRDLSDAARVIWQAIVASVAPEHFRASDSPLMRSFCEATALADRAAAELAESGAQKRPRT
jgi:hypothetical protein